MLVLALAYILEKVVAVIAGYVTLDFQRMHQVVFQFLFAFLDVVYFSALIVYPILASRGIWEEEQNIDSLIHEFPEALYFWTPNFYFDLFLRRC